MITKPRTIHLQKALDKIKREGIDTDIGSEYLLLLEQMSILTDIQGSYDERVEGVEEVIREMEKSRVQMESQFQLHIESSTVTDTKVNEIHARLMNPDDGLIVQSKDIQRRLGDLENLNEDEEVATKEAKVSAEQRIKEVAKEKMEKKWRITYIIAISVMVMAVFGKQIGLPLIKALLVILL